MRPIDREYVRSLMPRRDPAGHKGMFGKAYLLGGSVGYTGAPVLCAAAAERSGCALISPQRFILFLLSSSSFHLDYAELFSFRTLS